MTPPRAGLRTIELLASLSLATDLGTGQPTGHGLRVSLLSVAMARKLGLDSSVVHSAQQVSLLRFLGCTADSHQVAEVVGGDDIEFNSTMAPVMYGSRPTLLKRLVGEVGSGESLVRRASLTVSALRASAPGIAAHCEVAAILARRLGLDERVAIALLSAYERWDGKGLPAGLAGERIPVEARIAAVARDVDLFTRSGVDVETILRDRRGKGYDPRVVDAALEVSSTPREAVWDQVLDAEPEPIEHIADIDSALAVLADFADLKSPWARGHSRQVAQLARGGAGISGLSLETQDTVHRAGLIHDLGRVGVANGIWDKPGPLSTDEWEQVRMHPYLTDRIVSRCPTLASLSELASSHHERLDGSGYHRASTGDHLSLEVRLLAAADVMAAVMADRPHRRALDLEAASELLRGQVETGLLDGRAVECVIGAAGGEAATEGWGNPDGLTDREVEVLVLLCGELTNRQVAEELYISAKTVGRHVENIYAKIGVSTRAGAAVYAMEHRLLR